MDARTPPVEFAESFDLVLADVPCSGIGVIRKKRNTGRKRRRGLRLPEIQLDILRGLAPTVKYGGALLYSTCTVLRRENEGVIEAFLAENREFTAEEGPRTLFPHVDGTDGFFICKLRSPP